MIHHHQLVIHLRKEINIPDVDMILQMETYQGQPPQGKETERIQGPDNADKDMTLSKTHF